MTLAAFGGMLPWENVENLYLFWCNLVDFLIVWALPLSGLVQTCVRGRVSAMGHLFHPAGIEMGAFFVLLE